MVTIAVLVVSTRWVVKIKDHLPFCRELKLELLLTMLSKIKDHLPFCRELKLELLLTMLSKFEGEGVLKDSAF